MKLITPEFVVNRMVLIVLGDRIEHGLIDTILDDIMAGTQSIHAEATVGIKLWLKLILIGAMVAGEINTSSRD